MPDSSLDFNDDAEMGDVIDTPEQPNGDTETPSPSEPSGNEPAAPAPGTDDIADLWKGGWQTVASLSDRNSIAIESRSDGMAVHVLANGKTYVLVGGTGNDCWREYTTRQGVGDVDTEELEIILDDLTNRIAAIESKQPEVPDTLVADLNSIRERLQTLEDAPAPEVDPEVISGLRGDITKLANRIKALEDKPDPTPSIPEDLDERVSDVESKADANAQSITTLTTSVNNLSGLPARMEAAETSIRALADQPASNVKIVGSAGVVLPGETLTVKIESITL